MTPHVTREKGSSSGGFAAATAALLPFFYETPVIPQRSKESLNGEAIAEGKFET